MQKHIFTQEKISTIFREYSMIHIDFGYCVFKVIENKKINKIDRVNSLTTGNTVTSDKPYTVQGLCLISDFQKAFSDNVTPRPLHSLILSDAQLDLFAQYGFHVFDRNSKNSDTAFTSIKGIITEFNPPEFNIDLLSPSFELSYNSLFHSNIFDIIEAHPELLNSIYIVNSSEHYIKHLDGSYMPIGITFSYSDGNMSLKKYDLNMVEDFIKNRDGIIVFQSSFRSKQITEDCLQTSVPIYNNKSGLNKEIQFFIKPTKLEFNKMKQHIFKSGGFKSYTEAVWELDLFGLNSCSIANNSYHDYVDL